MGQAYSLVGHLLSSMKAVFSLSFSQICKLTNEWDERIHNAQVVTQYKIFVKVLQEKTCTLPLVQLTSAVWRFLSYPPWTQKTKHLTAVLQLECWSLSQGQKSFCSGESSLFPVTTPAHFPINKGVDSECLFHSSKISPE